MRIILDGLSGVGKSYVGEFLSNALGLVFHPYLPDFQESELSLHRSLIAKHNQLDNCIIEGSISMATLVKTWMFENDYISFADYMKCLSLNESYIHKNDIYVVLEDDYDDVVKRRELRSRSFEFNSSFSKQDILSLDEFISDYYLDSYYQISDNTRMVVINRELYDSIEELVDAIASEIKSIIAYKPNSINSI